mgnify:FL=1
MEDEPKIASPRKIKPVFRKWGFDYRLIRRQGNVVLYEQKSKYGNIISYEVMRVQTVKSPTEFHQVGDEYLPGTNSWGTLGWTLGTMEDAEKRFAEIVYRYEPSEVKISRRWRGLATD